MILPNGIAPFVLEDLRRAALYLEELGDADTTNTRDQASARQHAVRLWAASQAVERLVVAVEQLILTERSRASWGNGDLS